VTPPLPQTGRSVARGPESKDTPVKVSVDNLGFYYGAAKVLHDISIGLQSNQVSAFIGPSGCARAPSCERSTG